jgi:uncharacterized protein
LPPSGRSAGVEVVVSDAGPLIALGRLDLLAVLPEVFAQVQVPTAVLEECMVRPENADAHRIHAAVTRGWLVTCEAVPIANTALDLGERAAIARAVEIGAALLADDQAARQHALAIGLQVIGTLGVLVLAKRGGHLAAVGPLVAQLRASGQRLSHAAVAQALAAAGEGPS